jgi:hypothetical protein
VAPICPALIERRSNRCDLKRQTRRYIRAWRAQQLNVCYFRQCFAFSLHASVVRDRVEYSR